MRWRSGWARCARTTRASTPATSRSSSSRAGSHSAPGPLPEDSDLELRSGALEDELRQLGDDGVQSLLLEGGPTLAASFFRADLVDRVLVFVAPRLAGSGPTLVDSLPAPLELSSFDAAPVGEDVLLTAYVHEP